MISKQYRCIFVHIPKTAGTSIEAALGWFQEYTDDAQDHRRIGELRSAVSSADFHDYFKFTFVRNPWDRVVSWYKNVIEAPVHRTRYGISEKCSLPEFLKLHGNNFGLKPQLHWIRERNGRIPLDFVGRFEHIQEDFARVCERIGASDITLENGYSRSADRRSYVEFYDTKTREIVSKRYAEEIELFGYSFDNQSNCRFGALLHR